MLPLTSTPRALPLDPPKALLSPSACGISARDPAVCQGKFPDEIDILRSPARRGCGPVVSRERGSVPDARCSDRESHIGLTRSRCGPGDDRRRAGRDRPSRSEEQTSELQSLMRISYAVFCLKKKKHRVTITTDK